ncbi:hypothetical protein GCM10028796_21430 [Ramlibacter monticola]|uniref:AAA family ATPase n=1 Tax=Ramlibacter monticola TaxID=1926872 RepID=A0A936Z244_9BURK|nr:AAA family ATPase [Ramlibacter monticola]MBL0392396.1 AAA family ATPase [Ramlibacter monticola]
MTPDRDRALDPPHSKESEEAVLGALLLDSACAWPVATDVLGAQDFYLHEHRLIFDAVAAVIAAGNVADVDVLTVFERLQRNGEAEEVGGLPRLNELEQFVPSAANVRRYAEIVQQHAARRSVIEQAQTISDAAFGGDADELRKLPELAHRLTDAAQSALIGPSARAAFAPVPFADLTSAEPSLPGYVWDGLVPAGFVTLLNGHGGAGKGYLALMLAVAVAMGLPLFGIPTRRGIVAFYSGEDGADVLRFRLARVCAAMDVCVQDLEQRLFLLDATRSDPTLFTEVTSAGHRAGVTTATYCELREFMAVKGAGLLVVDNATDTYDASEIDRTRVRGFVRSLACIAQERDAGVLLLAHVDKGTSRGERAGTESYSGSTAWSNSARSRLFLTRAEDGALLLQHQKHNLGKLREPLRLSWPDGGVPTLDVPLGPVVQGISNRGSTKALLRLIAEFEQRGEHVTTATTSRTHAAKLLREESGFPKVREGEVFNLLRMAERAGHLERVTYKGADRKNRERWHVTDAGRALAELTAATAATAGVTACGDVPAEPAATAATSPLGGMGGKSAHTSPAWSATVPQASAHYGGHRE